MSPSTNSMSRLFARCETIDEQANGATSRHGRVYHKGMCGTTAAPLSLPHLSAKMASLDHYFTEETSDLLTKTPAYILDEALSHLASAIAALQRAGPLYSAHIEPFWHFAAGTELDYDYQVARASSLLPKKICVRQDVRARDREAEEGGFVAERVRG